MPVDVSLELSASKKRSRIVGESGCRRSRRSVRLLLHPPHRTDIGQYCVFEGARAFRHLDRQGSQAPFRREAADRLPGSITALSIPRMTIQRHRWLSLLYIHNIALAVVGRQRVGQVRD